MDPQRAKFLLQAGPPRAGDREDPAFTEAMARAEADPALGEWTRQQQKLTQALAGKLQEIEVPAHLKNHILAGGFVSQRARRFRRRWWLAAAAILALLLGLAVGAWRGAFSEPQISLAGLRTDMCEFLAGSFELELQSPSLARLREHLGRQHDFTEYTVPAALATQRGVGCRLIDWRNRQVALICFTHQGQLVHLLILPRSGLPAEAWSEGETREQVGEWATAGWVDSQNIYLVATRGTAELLEELL